MHRGDERVHSVIHDCIVLRFVILSPNSKEVLTAPSVQPTGGSLITSSPISLGAYQYEFPITHAFPAMGVYVWGSIHGLTLRHSNAPRSHADPHADPVKRNLSCWMTNTPH